MIECAVSPAAGPFPVDLPARMAVQVRVHPVTGCWLWQGTQTEGYGRVRLDGKLRRVHRVTYSMLAGPIPPGKILDHVWSWGCRYRHCCWPAHLEPVTHRENILRGLGLAAINAAKTRCDNGHEFTPENTCVIPSRPNARYCRTCINDRVRAAYRAKKGTP